MMANAVLHFVAWPLHGQLDSLDPQVILLM